MPSGISLGVPYRALDASVEEARRTNDGQLEASIILKVRQFVTLYLPAPLPRELASLGRVDPVDDTVDAVELDATVEHRCRVVLDPMTDRIVSAELVEVLAATL
jgi:hypothetical protein